MNIYDISKMAGVSIATVSRVINGSEKVSPKTRQKVLELMEKYSYTPNTFARGLGLNTIRTIGILCADSSDLYLAKAVYFLETDLREKNYDSILCCTGYDYESKCKNMKLLLSKKVDSVILVGSNFVYEDDEKNDYIREAAKSIPIMILNAEFDHPNVFCCLCDDYSATYDATESLIREGRRNILYFYNSTSFSGNRKLSGYNDAMTHAGLEPHAEFIDAMAGHPDIIEKILNKLKQFSLFDAVPDGIITSEDSLAVGVMKFIRRSKLETPKDVAVIGYNNSILSLCSEPELTSIDNRLEVLCRQLTANLVNYLQGEPIPSRTMLSAIIVPRSTT